MLNKYLILPICLSLALVACKDAVEDHVKSNKITAEVDHDALAAFKAKVRSSVGASKYLKAKSDMWKSLHVGQSVGDNDQIMTETESEVVLNTTDGTVLIISENSTVEFNTEFKSSIKGEVNIFIRNGNIQFDVQKQKNNQFNFKTGTATASIRGTAGFVGSLDGQMVASLKEGLVEVQDAKGRSSNIAQNQTLLVTKSGDAKTIQLESSGTTALFAALETMVKEGGLDNVEELEKSLQSFDAGYVEERNKFQENLTFAPVAIPKAVREPSVTLKAKLTPGVFVTVMGVTDTVPASGEYERTFTWDPEAVGTKRFMATCSDGSVEVSCNTWTTEYVDPAAGEVPAEEPAEDTLAKADSAVVDSAAPAEVAPVDSAKAPVEEVAKAVEPPAKKLVVRKTVAPADTALKLVIKLNDKTDSTATEVILVPKRKKEAIANMKITLSGIVDEDLSKVESITIYRDSVVVETITDLSALIYQYPVQLAKNQTAGFEVVAKLKNGTDYKARRTYEAR